VAGGHHARPLVRDRGARRHPGAGSGGRPLRAGNAVRGPCALRQDNRLHYLSNFLGSIEQKVVAAADVPTGEKLVLSASFEKTSQEPDHTAGTLSLYHGDEKVGEAEIKTQLGAFAIAGSGLYVGRHEGEPLTEDFPGPAPHKFTGGTIDRVAIDVSGDAYLDLEREAELMLMRE
jgi:arylsulfatase